MLLKVVFVVLVAYATATIYLDEKFDDGDAYKQRWIESTHKSDYGAFKLTAGKFYGDAEKDKGIQTSQDAHFYEFARSISTPFSNMNKDLVIQYTVKHEQKIDCGGGYIKLLPADVDLKDFNGDSPYQIMFGPDICGYSTKKVQMIINYKGKNYQNKEEIACKDDEYTHLYTLIIKPDNMYTVLIDNAEVKTGDITKDFDILLPKTIKDDSDKKPEVWVDEEYINDPEDKKPDNWETIEHIPDPEAKKPSDWDDEMDGEWEPPKIANPEFKGEWKAKQIKNPSYKGVWEQKEIPNPDYFEDTTLYKFDNIGAVGFDLWQVKSGTIFDNILITDDIQEAKDHAEKTWAQTKQSEETMHKKQEEEERKKTEAEDKLRETEDADKKDKKEDDDEPDDDEDKEAATKEKDEL